MAGKDNNRRGRQFDDGRAPHRHAGLECLARVDIRVGETVVGRGNRAAECPTLLVTDLQGPASALPAAAAAAGPSR